MLETKVLVTNHMSNVWDLKYDVAYDVVWVMGRQQELIYESDKTLKVNV